MLSRAARIGQRTRRRQPLLLLLLPLLVRLEAASITAQIKRPYLVSVEAKAKAAAERESNRLEANGQLQLAERV